MESCKLYYYYNSFTRAQAQKEKWPEQIRYPYFSDTFIVKYRAGVKDDLSIEHIVWKFLKMPHFSKTRWNGPFWAFLMNFYALKM